MIFGINKWILKFVSLDLVDIKFLNNNRWRIWFWRNQHFTDRGGVGGLLSNHRDLRVHHQSCLFHVQCHMYLFWSTGRHTVAIAFFCTFQDTTTSWATCTVWVWKSIYFSVVCIQKYLSNGYRAIDVMQPRRGSMGERIYWCVMIMFWSGLNSRAHSHNLCTSPGA